MAGCGVILLVTGGVGPIGGGDQLAGKGHVVDIDQQQAGIAQQGTPAPVGAAEAAGKHQGQLFTVGREQAQVLQAGELIGAVAAIPGGQAPGVRRHEEGIEQLRRGNGLGLGACRALAGYLRGRYRLLGNLPQGFARQAVENKHKPLLGQLREGGNDLAVFAPVEQNGLRRGVVVPQVVAHMLEMPAQFATVQVERNHAVGIEVVTRTVHAVIIRRGGAGGQVEQPMLLIDRHGRPDIGTAAAAAGMALQGVELPQGLTAEAVECHHGPARRGGAHEVDHSRTGHHYTSRHHRCRGVADFARYQAFITVELHPAALAEAGTGPAVSGVDSPQLAVVGAQVQPVAAGLTDRCAGFPGVTHPATAEGAVAAVVDLRVEAPALRAACRVQRDHAVERGAVHQGFAGGRGEQDGGALGRGLFHLLAVGRHIAAAESPGDLEVLYVGSIDLCGFGVVPAALVTAIIQPAGLGPGGRHAANRRQQGQQPGGRGWLVR